MATVTTYTGCTACCATPPPNCCTSGSSAFSFSGTNRAGNHDSASGTATYVSGSQWRLQNGTTSLGKIYTINIACSGTNTWTASIAYSFGSDPAGDDYEYASSDLTYDAGTNTFTGSVLGVFGSGPMTLTFSSPC